MKEGIHEKGYCLEAGRGWQAARVVLPLRQLPGLVTTMAWERRERGERYYTRSRKEGGRVVREYVGGGRLGELAARTDAEVRERRKKEIAEGRAEVRRMEQLVAPVVELCEVAEVLAGAHLVAAGCHRHKGEWRRRRERRD
jgi:hypothetical protein